MYAVLFDIDGTLLLTAGAGLKAFAAAFAELFGLDSFTSKVPFAGRSDRAIALDLMRLHGIEPSAENWHRFVQAYPSHLDKSLAECDGQILPGVVALLDRLQAMEHVLVGLLTGNLRSGAAQKLSHYGLAERFRFGGYGDTCTDRNGIALQAYEQARMHARGNLSGVMVIGDTEHDIQCARSIDAVAVAVPTGFTSADQLSRHHPDLLLNDLTEIQPLLDRIVG
jgi:phosphoglycolate phosphatase